MPTHDHTVWLAVLDLLASKHESFYLDESIWWRTDTQYAPVTFFANCNDEFYWACADAEEITSVADVVGIRQAIMDVRLATGGKIHHDSVGVELWVARKRGMRPQQPSYRECYPQETWPLFDACGPERDPKSEG